MTVVWHHEHHRHARYVAPDRFAIGRLLVLAFLVFTVIIGGGWFAWSGWRSGLIPSAIESWVYVPIGIDQGHMLWYPRVARIARGIAAADGRASVAELDYAQSIEVIERRNALDDLADEFHVTVSDDDVERSVTWTDDLRAFESLATWSDDEYLTYIARSVSLSTAVESVLLTQSEYQDASQARLDAVKAKLDLGIAFPDVAKEYSEDPSTAQVSGSFGYVLPSDIDAVFAPVFDLPENVVSDVITTDELYWLVRREETVTDESGTRTLLRGIAIRKTALADVLDDITAESEPFLWVR